MLKARNSDREIELRKYRDILETVGSGIKIFAIWTILKVLGLFVFYLTELNDFLLETQTEEMSLQEQKLLLAITYAIMAMIVLVMARLQIYVGDTAISVARGTNKKDKKLYIVLAALMLINCIVTIVATIDNTIKRTDLGVMGQFRTSIVVELTFLVMLTELLIASYRINRLTKGGKHLKR